MSNYCLGEIVKTKSEFIDLVSQASSKYSFVELWLDFIEDFSFDFLEEVANKYEDKLLVLLRRNDGKDLQIDFETRKEIIKFLGEKNIFLDLDFVVQAQEVEIYKSLDKKPPLILSFHSYKDTPGSEFLDGLILEMKKIKNVIYKIACFCNSQKDAVRLLDLYERNLDLEGNLIVIGGGPFGKLTRVAAYLWDQPIIYAPKDSAKFVIGGQLTLEQYKKLEEIL